MAERDSLPSQEGPGLDVDAAARGLAELEFDARVALPEAQERFKRAEAERDRYRAGIQWVRGMCTDEEPHTVIDAKLAEILNGRP